jgi:hypothetical protein
MRVDEDFHHEFLPRFIDAQRAFHAGDPEPNAGDPEPNAGDPEPNIAL